MEPDHPERVAAWLSEVFGGPKFYSQRYGGYSRMISQHLNKHLTEAQRARWVSLLCRSADEALLAADPEFRAAFVAYLEWGTRIAVENSQSDARPPEGMPVPRWWWVCDATPSARPPSRPTAKVAVADLARTRDSPAWRPTELRAAHQGSVSCARPRSDALRLRPLVRSRCADPRPRDPGSP